MLTAPPSCNARCVLPQASGHGLSLQPISLSLSLFLLIVCDEDSLLLLQEEVEGGAKKLDTGSKMTDHRATSTASGKVCRYEYKSGDTCCTWPAAAEQSTQYKMGRASEQGKIGMNDGDRGSSYSSEIGFALHDQLYL
jgi:hypothetical protein